jgi:hypothetical protein
VGRVAAVLEQGGDQPVAVVYPAAVWSGHGQLGFDDPHRQPVQAGQVGAIGQMLQHVRAAGGLAAREQLRSGVGDLGEEGVRVESPSSQLGIWKRKQLPIVLVQRAPFASTRPDGRLFTRWIEAGHGPW